MPCNMLRASGIVFSVDFTLCCGIVTVIVAYDFVLIKAIRN